MDIIPVIDLLHGQVVRAQLGERHHYRPIKSGLCQGSEPLFIVRALLELYPFKTLYIADLDAIQGTGSHHAVITALGKHFPQLDLWLDAGLRNVGELQAWRNVPLTHVIGSENLASLAQYEALAAAVPAEKNVLSLDFSRMGHLGGSSIHEHPALWPERVIAMTLARVGSNAGPDLARLQELHQHGRCRLYAAGGVRHREDLHTLRQMGVAGALVASALHDGHLTAADLAQ